MKKIISLFQRNYDGDRLVRNEVTPGAEWVLAGEGVATRKWDGSCCMIRDGKLFKRYEVKPGKKPPEGFEPATELDENTGKTQGWLAVGNGPDDRWHREAFGIAMAVESQLVSGAIMCSKNDGTYELCGPKINGNADGFQFHVLVKHGGQKCPGCPRDFDLLKAFFEANDIEGIVWHHPDGRMVKIKAKDFGLKRKSQ